MRRSAITGSRFGSNLTKKMPHGCAGDSGRRRLCQSAAAADREPDCPAQGREAALGGLARSANSWSGGSMGTSGFRPKAPSMRFWIVTAWSSAAAGRATARAARHCPRAPRPMICGAPTSRASSSSATDGTAIRRETRSLREAGLARMRTGG
jgi:hypothetical protein